MNIRNIIIIILIIVLIFSIKKKKSKVENLKWVSSCHGWDCSEEDSYCPPGAPGSNYDGYCCKDGKWTWGKCSGESWCDVVDTTIDEFGKDSEAAACAGACELLANATGLGEATVEVAPAVLCGGMGALCAAEGSTEPLKKLFNCG